MSLAFCGGSLYAEKALLARFDEGRQTWYGVQLKTDYAAVLVLA